MASISLCLRLLEVVVIFCVVLERSKGVDWTLKDNASGTDVVYAVIIKLRTCDYLKPTTEHRFLRRVAHVETGDGENVENIPGGGIWAINQVTLQKILFKLATNSSLLLTCTQFSTTECQIETLPYKCILKPLYSGLVASMYISFLEANIPISSDIHEQANFWLDEYPTHGGSVKNFKKDVEQLDKDEACKVNVDIFFVLDASSTIDKDEFREVLEFEERIVSALSIGLDDDRVGTITFGTHAHIEFNLSKYDNKSELITAIRSITQLQGGTHTADGLCKLNQSLAEARHSDTVLRIAIVMSDGKSTIYDKSNDCHWNTMEAAAGIHQLEPPVLVYAIGVSDSVDEDELNAIATNSDRVVHIDEFDKLNSLTDVYIDDICWRAKVEIFNETSGSLDESEVINYVLTIPSLGMTLQVCVLKGKIQLYGSVTLPNPNSALNIFTLNLNCSHTECQMNSVCQDIYVPYNQGLNTRSVQDETDRESVVHISVKGASAGKNSFILNTTEGSTHDGCAGNGVTIGCGGHSSDIVLVITTTSVLVLLAFFSLFAMVCACAVYRRKKQRQMMKEDEHKLLDNEYTVM